AALEAGAHLAALARGLAFAAATGRLPDTRAGAAALADARAMRAHGGLEIMKRESRDRRLRLRPRFPFRFRFRRGHLLLPFLLGRHFDEVPHLLEHAAQRGMIRVHDFILMMLETQGL